MVRPYYRRDRSDGITPPDLLKTATYAEHVVRARGKRTQFTSISFDPQKIRDFGDALYRLKDEAARQDGHGLVYHENLIGALREIIEKSDKAERARAIQGLRYAKRRREGLVHWKFDVARIARTTLIGWTHERVQKYFARV